MTPDPLEAVVPTERHGERLDRFLADAAEGAWSRTRIADWVREGLLTIDGVVVDRPGHRLEAGQFLRLVPPEPEAAEPGSQMEPVVLHEEETFAVIDKPAGLPMHGNSPGDPQASVANWLRQRWGPDLPIGQGAERPGIVHRLDRGTSGVCVVAFRTDVFEDLMAQFAERAVEKEYLALCYGRPRFQSDWIERRLGADPRRPGLVRATNSTEPGTRDALTFWEVQEGFDGFALLRVKPRTGRKHQIRVHLADAGLPLIGDPAYRARNHGSGQLPAGCPPVERTLLHAYKLRLEHPIEGGEVTYTADLPEPMRAVLRHLREHAPAATE